jgi:hypothetical protein
MTQMQLAEKWAESIKFCLADAAAIDKYLSMMTGNYPALVAGPRSEAVAYAPAGMLLPIKLTTAISSETSLAGDPVEALLSTDVPLRTSQSATMFEAYLPAGSVALGQLVPASSSYLGKNAFAVHFNQIRTPDGEVIPISAHVLGGVGKWEMFHALPPVAECAMDSGVKPTVKVGLLASKGDICGGWVGSNFGAALEIPYDKLVFKRHIGVLAPSGEPMMLQLAAPTAIAVCTNCGGTRL